MTDYNCIILDSIIHPEDFKSHSENHLCSSGIDGKYNITTSEDYKQNACVVHLGIDIYKLNVKLARCGC